jgi:hypothetical protein|tara:strand:- start:2050 stop:2250 length:201 start_codon:yes stop_codon:yes gene_type:complete
MNKTGNIYCIHRGEGNVDLIVGHLRNEGYDVEDHSVKRLPLPKDDKGIFKEDELVGEISFDRVLAY